MSRLQQSEGGEILFYLGFLPLLFVLLWKTTAFPQFEVAELLAMAFFTGCAALKMLLYDRWKIWEIGLLLISLAIAGFSYYKSRFSRPLVCVIAVFGARGLDGRKILQCWLVMSLLNLVLAMSAGLLGIIDNYSYSRHEEGFLNELLTPDKAYALGLIYKTDCAARIFFTALVWFYLRSSRLRWFEYVAAVAIACVLFVYTDARLDSGCILIMALFFGLTNLILSPGSTRQYPGLPAEMPGLHRGQELWKRILVVSAGFSFPIFAAVSLLLCRFYRPGGFMEKLDEWSSSRLSLGHQIFADYGITLFGQPIELYGNGAHGKEVILAIEGVSYNFVDISYQSVPVLYGAVFFVLVLAGWLWIVFQKRRDYWLMLSILLCAFNCMIAHHLTEIAYIPFILLVFTPSAIMECPYSPLAHSFKTTSSGGTLWKPTKI